MPNESEKRRSITRQTKSSVRYARCPGYLDTNIIIHASSRDAHAVECSRLRDAVRQGHLSVLLESYVVHELMYSLSRYAKKTQRSDVAEYGESIIHLRGLRCDRETLLVALEHGRDNQTLDSWIASW
jgi:predicted nucleic acid-binding protein